MRKPRADSKLFQLTPEQQALVAEWLQTESYKKVRERIRMDFDMSVNDASLSAFWQRICQERLAERLRRAACQADHYATVLKETHTDWDAAIVGQIKQKIFEEGAADRLTEKQLVGLLITYADLKKVDARESALKLMREKLELDFRKYRDAVAEKKQEIEKTLKGAKEGGLTSETISKIEESLRLL